MSATNLSEITAIAELLEKVEEYKTTTSHLRISHPGIDEIIWTIPNLKVEIVSEFALDHNSYSRKVGNCRGFCISGDGYHIHAVSVPVE